MRSKNLFIPVMLAISICGCNGKQNKDMTFKINPALLGPVYKNTELGFSFSAPAGCQQIAGEVLDAAKQQLQNQVAASDSFYLAVEEIFMNPDDEFLCILSTMPRMHGKSASSDYMMTVAEKFKSHNVRQNSFTYHGFTIHQTLVMTDDKTIFKLFVPRDNHKSFQIDYIVSSKNYQKNLEAIESSIGSLEKI